ncbi:MAG TPA: LamG domain-containing protein, partial [Thermodesulfobacteriota bacterium]|nr:LamG domain-containing protein [Thermodesulfobacteriota bacterium]
MSATKSRLIQYLIIILILLAVGGGYYYYHSNAAQKINSSKVNNLTSGLVGYWTFDGADMTATQATNKASGGQNGTLNGTTRAIGKIGQSLNFNGSSDYVEVPDSGNTYDFGTEDFSVSMWLKQSILGAGATLVEKRVASLDGYFFKINNTDNTLRARITGTVFSGGPAISDTNWHHVVAVVQNGSTDTVTWYVDSNVSSPISGAMGDVSSDVPLTIGYSPAGGGDYFPGSLDEVRIYNHALSASEITELYQQGQTKINASQVNKLTEGLVGYWTMDGNNISGTSLTDSSGNNNTGTIGNAVAAIGKIGQALNFDSTTDYIEVTDPGTSSLDNITSEITISAWIKLDTLSFSRGYIMRKVSSFIFAVDDNDNCDQSDGKFTLFVSGSICSNLDVIDKANKWYHVVLTYTSGSYVFYVDGQSAGSYSAAFAPVSNNNSTFIGNISASSNFYFPGQIDEARIYSRALSASEITELYQQGQTKINASQVGKLESGLVAYYTMNGQDTNWTSS